MNGTRGPDYGFDAPAAPVGLAAAAVLSVGVAVLVGGVAGDWWWLIPLASAVLFGLSTASFVYTTRRGKHVVWAGLIDDLRLGGDERVLDLGCGRGAVLTAVAARVPGGCAVGVDLWRSVDQSGNDPARALRNAAIEGVAVDLLTADMRAVPLVTGSVDVVVSSLAIHNIPSAEGRLEAVVEAARVLRPGGRLVLADFRHTRAYADRLATLGLTGVTVRDAGWRFWYGGPWARTGVLTATR
jgi:arsenite methyltransferase